MDELAFALALLGPANDAVGPPPAELLAPSAPLSHYYHSASHNSYVVGDQLTGVSRADAYRRQLLQGCRHLKIDCWDGKRGPKVTHGNTLVTDESLDEVARAIAECAFVASELPVILSLEMHCSSKQQAMTAATLRRHLGPALLDHDELAFMGRRRGVPAERLSPLHLKRRILLNGGRAPASIRTTRRSPPTDAADPVIGIDGAAQLWAATAIRAVPVRDCLAGNTSHLLSVTSISEARLLEALGLTVEEQARLAPGLVRAARPAAAHGNPPAETRRRKPAGARLPPAGFGSLTEAHEAVQSLQQRAASPWIVRVVPHGLRFSGKNMNPLPSWLAGCQAVALNLCNTGAAANDLPAQLHHALFHRTQGYVLKPHEMRSHEGDDEVPLRSLTPIVEADADRCSERLAAASVSASAPRETASSSMAAAASAAAAQGERVLTLRVPRRREPEQQKMRGWEAARDGQLGVDLDDRNVVTEPGPTAAVGLRVGDRVLAVDGVPLGGRKLQLVMEDLARREVHELRLLRLEPRTLRTAGGGAEAAAAAAPPAELCNVAVGWPPPRDELCHVALEMLSVHFLPTHGERRPRLLDGRRRGSHAYLPELSGTPAPPRVKPGAAPPLRPRVCVSLYHIGGFCAVGGALPLPAAPHTEFSAPCDAADGGGGLHARVGATAHCLATEPHSTFLRVSIVHDGGGGGEIAYETAVLGRLRSGYRVRRGVQIDGAHAPRHAPRLARAGQRPKVLRLREPSTGTRIELCTLLVRVTRGALPHEWATLKELRHRDRAQRALLAERTTQLAQRTAELERANQALSDGPPRRDL